MNILVLFSVFHMGRDMGACKSIELSGLTE
jgi:hypothetical protein